MPSIMERIAISLGGHNMKLEGKRIVITGAGSGIGLALLKDLLKIQHVKIVAADLNIDSIKDIAPQVLAVRCDLSEPFGTDEVLERAQEWMGGVDVYFANAGFAYYETVGAANWKRLERIYATNVLTPIYTFQKVRELAAGKPFRVVVTASAMGYLPIPGYAVYGATKASLVSFTEAIRWELQDPACLTLLNPIATRTKFFQQEKGCAPTPFPSQTPEQVARKAIQAVLADRQTIFPSFIFRLTLLFNRVLPAVGWIYQKQQQWVLRKWDASSKDKAPVMRKVV